MGGYVRILPFSESGGGGAVDSVNGQTGVVVLDAADVGADPAGTAQTLFDTLGDKYVRTTRFEIINSGTSGTVTLPSNSTVILDDFGGTVDAVVSQAASGKPTFIAAETAADEVVATTFDSSGNWSFTGTPSAYPVAILYRVRTPLEFYDDTEASVIGIATYETPALEYFNELRNTTAPNATVPVHSFQAKGSESNIDAAFLVKGTGAFLLQVPDNTTTGGNKRGASAVDLQLARTANTQVASGANSFAVGSRNTTSAANGIAIGFANNVTANTAIGIGASNGATGANALAVGAGNTAAGTASVASGANSNTGSLQARKSHSSGLFGSAGDSQFSYWDIKCNTTNATATQMTLGNITAGAATRVLLPNNTAFAFHGIIVGKQTGSTNCAAWEIKGLIVRGANAASTTIVGTPTITAIDNSVGWGTPTLAADTTNGCLTVSAVGLAATDIRWDCTLRTTEVIYS